MFHVKHSDCGWVVGKKGCNMNITNSQIKALINVYDMIMNAQNGSIPVSDISNIYTIKRYQKVLNDLLKEKIKENKATTEYYTIMRKELSQCEIK